MTQCYYDRVYVFLLLFRKGMFGKLKKKKKKAEKGLILANKAAQGEAFVGAGRPDHYPGVCGPRQVDGSLLG